MIFGNWNFKKIKTGLTTVVPVPILPDIRPVWQDNRISGWKVNIEFVFENNRYIYIYMYISLFFNWTCQPFWSLFHSLYSTYRKFKKKKQFFIQSLHYLFNSLSGRLHFIRPVTGYKKMPDIRYYPSFNNFFLTLLTL